MALDPTRMHHGEGGRETINGRDYGTPKSPKHTYTHTYMLHVTQTFNKKHNNHNQRSCLFRHSLPTNPSLPNSETRVTTVVQQHHATHKGRDRCKHAPYTLDTDTTPMKMYWCFLESFFALHFFLAAAGENAVASAALAWNSLRTVRACATAV